MLRISAGVRGNRAQVRTDQETHYETHFRSLLSERHVGRPEDVGTGKRGKERARAAFKGCLTQVHRGLFS